MNENTKTTLTTPNTAQRNWVVIDVENQPVGRAASKIAQVLRGKHRASFTPNVDAGDFVIVLNADKLVLTGNKMAEKEYHRHTGYVGHLRTRTAREMQARRPGQILTEAVWGMLPKNKLSRHVLAKLHVYAGTEHPHAAQQPQQMTL